MKGLIFCVLTLVLGGVIGLGLEKLASFLPLELANAMTRVYGVGIHPLALRMSLCGLLGLVAGYVIISHFVRK